MALTIIRVSGPAETGKSETIRQFTAEHLGYWKERGDVLGVFPMPRRPYAVGMNGYGDNLDVVREGLEFLDCYSGLRIMIVATRSGGATVEEVERFAKRKRAILLPPIETMKLDEHERDAAIKENVAKILRLMPGREC